MTEQTHRGGCHCGAVQYEAVLDLDSGTLRCNCSLCGKSRAWFAFAPADQFQLESGADNLVDYRWTPDGKAEPNLTYHSCATCGVRTHADGVGPGGAATVAIQVATIEDADPEVLAKGIRYVDGLHDHFDQQPKDVRLL